MKCIKCGMENADNSKFCGYCGTPVEQPQQNENPVNNEQPIQPAPAVQQTNVVAESTVQPVQPVQQPTEEPKKNSNKGLLIACLIVAIIAVAGVLYFTLFNKTTKVSTSIDALEKAISNLQQKTVAENTSGTIKLSAVVEAAENQNLSLSGTLMYQKSGDNVKLNIAVDKSMFFDAMSLYANVEKDKVSLYTKSSLIDMFAGTASEKDSWVYYVADLTETPINFEEIKMDTKVDLSELKNNFKYIGKDGKLNHYTLTIDKDMAEKMKSELPAEDYEDMLNSLDTLNGSLVIDLYINNKEELEKISMDLSQYMKDSEVSKAIITIEFKDFNNTTIDIPTEALNGIELEKYISENMPKEIDQDAEFNF